MMKTELLKENPMESRFCAKCEIEKPIDSFYFFKKTNRFDIYCKGCERARKRQFYKDNTEKEKLRKRKYYLKNREKIIKNSQSYYAKTRPDRLECAKKRDLKRNCYGWKKPANFKELPLKTWIVGNHRASTYMILERRTQIEVEGFAKRLKRSMEWRTNPFVLCVDESPYIPNHILSLLKNGSKKQFKDRTLTEKLKEENADIWRYYTLEEG